MRSAEPIGGKGKAGQHAVAHSCEYLKSACIELRGDRGERLGCYDGRELVALLPGDICIQNHFYEIGASDGGGRCALDKCDRRTAHVHAYSKQNVLQNGWFPRFTITEVVLPACKYCMMTSRALQVGDEALDVEKKDIGFNEGGDSSGTTLVVEGICCATEASLVEKVLIKVPGVEHVLVNVTARTVIVRHDHKVATAEQLARALTKASFPAYVKIAGQKKVAVNKRNCRVQLLAIGGLSLAASLLSFADPDEESGLHWLKFGAFLAAIIGLPRIAFKAFNALRLGMLDINCLMTIAACGAIGIGEYIEAGAVVFLFGLSEWLEHKASAKARNALAALLEMRPETATLASTGEKVPVERVRVGDHLRVLVGDKVPVDATVVSGSSSLDESALTGESAPVKKEKGSKVSAGSVNVGSSYLELEALAAAKDSAVARMVKLIEEAHAARSRTEKRVETFAKVYTPVVVCMAALMASVPWIFLDKKKALEWLHTALVLLVIACPCALVISTPITYVSTLSTAATHKVLIRGGEYLEELGSITAIGLDKTGTLTEGRFCVREVIGPFAISGGNAIWPSTGDISRARLLSLVASVEQKSSHPIGASFVAYAQGEGADATLHTTEFLERAGEGIDAFVEGTRVQVGSRRFVESWGRAGTGGICLVGPLKIFKEWGAWTPPSQPVTPNNEVPMAARMRVKELEEAGQTVCYIGLNGRLTAIFSVADAPRVEARDAVAALQSLGVEPVMLTGDRKRTAEAVASHLGISTVRAELLPRDKVLAVSELKEQALSSSDGSSWHRLTTCGMLRRQGGVAMTGDGINDAAALAASSVGIAMGAGGTQVAIENAHVVLMDSDLHKLVLSVRLGRLAVRKIKQNIAFSLVSKAAMVAITMAGYATLWGAILADVGSMLVVTFNSSAVLNQRASKKIT